MDVSGVRRKVIAGHPVVDVRVGDEAEVLERLERSIDRRQRHRRPIGDGDRLDDLLRSGVTELLDRVEDLLALRCEPPAGGSQTRAEITHPTNVCRSAGSPRMPT